MSWSGVRVLVTGAGGFLGSHLVEELAKQGGHLRAFVRYNSRADVGLLRLLPSEILPRVEIRYGDLRDSLDVFQAMEGCDFVFHLGALISIPYSYQHPRDVVETNVIGTLNILEGARRMHPHRVIHVSTSEVYGTAKTVPISESHPLQGQSPYSASKIGADKVVESYHRCFGVPVTTVRPFNTYGPRQSARAVIPTIIMQALAGHTVSLGSLHPTRDFTFVSDTVGGFLLAAAAEDAIGREINLGSGHEISIGDLTNKIIGLIGRSVPIVCEEHRMRPSKGEVERLRADNSLARKVLGWQPAVSLDEGLRRTIAWIQEHLALYRVEEYNI